MFAPRDPGGSQMLMESRHEVEIARMERVLRSYGVLTRERLCEMCHREHMPVNVRVALDEAIQPGRIVALGDVLSSSRTRPRTSPARAGARGGPCRSRSWAV